MSSGQSLWFPYAQMRTLPPPLEVVSACGARLRLADGRELVDAVSSWWSVIHGYNHPELNAALQEQLSRMAHVMLGGLIHEPARALADTLARIAPGDLNHVFFSDSGSVAVEVALKMAVQCWRNRGQRDKTRFLSLRRAYHGDTWMAMSVCDPDDGMHALFSGVVADQEFVSVPGGGWRADEESLAAAVRELREALRRHGPRLAAFIVEPVLQGAGGMHVYDPRYLAEARRLCDEYNVLLIFDEVATGFGRTGRMFAAEHAGVVPDIMALGKGLTAGYLGHAATLARDSVYDAFLGDDASTALMHGPTFMGNPLACAVGLKSVELLQRDGDFGCVARIERILRDELGGLSHSAVREVRVLGAMAVCEVADPSAYRGLQAFAAERGVWLRPFDRSVYTMPPYIIADEELRRVTGVIREWFS